MRTGLVYLFDVTTGEQIGKLEASDAHWGDRFGSVVAISGNTAIVGARSGGAAYLFDITTGEEIAILTASDASSVDSFGRSVDLNGQFAIVGASLGEGLEVNTGAVYIFDVTNGNQIGKLTASDGENGDYFGYSVAISDTTAIVGAYKDDGDGGESGSAYIFDLLTGNEIAKFTASDAGWNDFFGKAVGISGDTVIVGAPGDDDHGAYSGAVYVFDVPEPSAAILLALSGMVAITRRRKS